MGAAESTPIGEASATTPVDLTPVDPLWTPSAHSARRSQMTTFRKLVNKVYGLDLANYEELYKWSIDHNDEFWAMCWQFCKVVHHAPYTQVRDNSQGMPFTKWFVGARFNFAENLLRYRDDHLAMVFYGEARERREISYRELYSRVSQVQKYLRDVVQLKPGDRVVACLPNIPETVIAMLATTSLGGIWSCCSPDYGSQGMLDRFQQIKPRVMFFTDGYFYKGKFIDITNKCLEDVAVELPSLEGLIHIPFRSNEWNDWPTMDPDVVSMKYRTRLVDIYREYEPVRSDESMTFVLTEFDHPVYILYSSGTTGKPKSIVHRAGGVLLEHMKELILHCDLTRSDRIFYFTTIGWMMWQWLVSSLAVGATLMLYEGNPFHPQSDILWKLAAEDRWTIFGTSAKYISVCADMKMTPKEKYDLSSLRAVTSTGSPLSPEYFEYVYQAISPNVMLGSISGGTDIVACWFSPNPTLPVFAGRCQCIGLGLNVQCWDMNDEHVVEELGELVCVDPAPSMPLKFWGDSSTLQKYKDAYFTSSTKPHIWYHGDFIMVDKNGGIMIAGRSDATLNPGGVRIGTAEIYRVVDQFSAEVEDSLLVGQQWEGDERIVLFVKLAPKSRSRSSTAETGISSTEDLTAAETSDDPYFVPEELQRRLKHAIRAQCTPRHVPAKIVAIEDIPHTMSGKKVEIAVKRVIHGQMDRIKNRESLSNPESLDLYVDIPALQQ